MLRGMSSARTKPCKRCQTPFPCPLRKFGEGREPLYCSTGCRLASDKARADARREAVRTSTLPPPTESQQAVAARPKLHRDRRKGVDPATTDRVYEDEEREWLVAVERYKRAARRPFPVLTELFRILLDLGYRKPHPVAPAQPDHPAGNPAGKDGTA